MKVMTDNEHVLASCELLYSLIQLVSDTGEHSQIMQHVSHHPVSEYIGE